MLTGSCASSDLQFFSMRYWHFTILCSYQYCFIWNFVEMINIGHSFGELWTSFTFCMNRLLVFTNSILVILFFQKSVFCIIVLTYGNAPELHDTQEAASDVLTVPLDFEFETDATVTAVSFYVMRASDTVTLALLRPVTVATTCEFTVVAQWTTPTLTATGWQRVGRLMPRCYRGCMNRYFTVPS